MTGIYPGRFSVALHYELVKKYSALENRDIWEYTLDLTSAKIQSLVEHLWELRLALRLQPAFHELIDPEEGCVNGAQNNFLDWRVHYDLDEEAWRTERISLIDIAPITPRDNFFTPWSWTVRAGWQRVTLPQQDRYKAAETTLAFQLHAGRGLRNVPRTQCAFTASAPLPSNSTPSMPAGMRSRLASTSA